MRILALDTTTRAGSVALVTDGHVTDARGGDASRPHAERLPGDLVGLLEAHGLSLQAVDAFAVAAGPGSFTGLRIGIATIQGLAFALGRPVVGVSVLDALAVVAFERAASDLASRTGADGMTAGETSAEERTLLVGAFMDAQRNEVFATLYRAIIPIEKGNRAGKGSGTEAQERMQDLPTLEPADGPVSEAPASVLVRWAELLSGRAMHIAGDGVARYGDLVARIIPAGRPVDPLPPLAPVVGRMAYRDILTGGGVRPHAVRPLYVRRSDAELARDRMRSLSQGAGRDA